LSAKVNGVKVYAVDTSVFVEYFNEESPLARKAELLLDKSKL